MNTFLRRFAWPAAVLLAWLLDWRHLAGEWIADEQYRFGFGVPLLSAWIAWRRFPGPVSPAAPGAAWWCVVVLALAAISLGSALVWHDPLWRLTGWVLSAGAALLAAAWLLRLGGSPLLRRQLFPLFFTALAVPWPVPVELWTIRHLAGAVTDVAVTAVNFLGIPALQHGNAIELAGGFVGVDEACSGIQSLQSVLMASLFLGEFFAMSALRRASLVAVGAAISFLANSARVLALTVVANSHGGTVSDGWHDWIGGGATTLMFMLLLLASWLFSRRSVMQPAGTPASAFVAKPEGVVLLALVLAIPLVVRAWFSGFETDAGAAGRRPVWMLSPDHIPQGSIAERMEPPKSARTLLRFSEWQSFMLRNADGDAAQIIRLAWGPDARTPAFVTNHTPAVCMSSAGWIQQEPPFLLHLQVRGAQLPCAAYPFGRAGTRILALQFLAAGGQVEPRLVDPARIPGTLQRLKTLWTEPRRQITEELLLYIPDPGDEEARKKSAAAFLEAVLVRSGR